MKEVYKALDEVITCIQNSEEYQTCISLKEKMKDNEEIRTLVEDVKKYQKEYIRSGYDSKIKEQLDDLEERLNTIPIYVVYLNNLTKVNERIDYVKDSLNDYVDKLFNTYNIKKY